MVGGSFDFDTMAGGPSEEGSVGCCCVMLCCLAKLLKKHKNTWKTLGKATDMKTAVGLERGTVLCHHFVFLFERAYITLHPHLSFFGHITLRTIAMALVPPEPDVPVGMPGGGRRKGVVTLVPFVSRE